MTTGESRRTRGIVLLGLILVLTGGAVGGGVALTRHVRSHLRERQHREEIALAQIAEGFTRFVSVRLMIPGPDEWPRAVAEATGMSAAMVLSGSGSGSGSGFASVRRCLLIDRGLGDGMLPYRQDSGGLEDPRSGLLTDTARVLLVSCSAPGLAMPFRSGLLERPAFDAIWNWIRDPATGAPPKGWPEVWRGNGGDLHVARISLNQLFAPIHLKQARYGGGGDPVSSGAVRLGHLAVEPMTTVFLKGTFLAVGGTNGSVQQVRVVRGEESFDFTPPSDPNADDGKDKGGKDKGGEGEEATP
ncbi:MAG: hypothetical protein AB7O66_20555 [Limisphaerales bacterium]